jgi:ketosteroid isomerase-like protein
VDVNRLDVIAEVAAAFARYEEALAANDVETMTELFWDSELATRIGIDDHQHGAAAIAAWRATQPPLPSGRELSETRIVSFGSDLAVVTTMFRYPGPPQQGRQSQTWARLAGEWRIVAAHVSHPSSRRGVDDAAQSAWRPAMSRAASQPNVMARPSE